MIAVVLVFITAAGVVGALLVLSRSTAELRVPKPLAAGVRISTASLRGVWTAAAAVRIGRPRGLAASSRRAEQPAVSERDVELAVRERLYGERRRGSGASGADRGTGD
jgi:hypothetical protein